MAGYQIYEKVGGQLVPINLTTEERLSQVEQSCLDYHNNGIKDTDLATETKQGIVALATVAEVVAGTDHSKAVTAKGVAGLTATFQEGLKTAQAEVKALTTKVNNLETGFQDDVVQTVISRSTEPWYRRPTPLTCDKRSVTIPKDLYVQVGQTVYRTSAPQTISISNFGNTAGGNFYIYACVSGSALSFVISSNSTVPSGYTAENSRKIGGFHTLCLDVGTIADHKLSGYVTGDILPASLWDLWHRPKGNPEGYVYVGDNGCDVWVSIYLLSWDGKQLVSTFGGTCADGASTKKWHGELFKETLDQQNQRLLYRPEFVWAARGSNEETNIKGGNDAGTTGGHVDTKNVRMISNYGLEDACGFMWQWLENVAFGGSGWTECVYNSDVDDKRRGGVYGWFNRLLAGGYWNGGSGCGSRSLGADSASSSVGAGRGGRGASEPLHVSAKTVNGYPF